MKDQIEHKVIFLIPAFLILPEFFGLQGVWIAGPLADLFSALISVIAMVLEMKKLNKEIQSDEMRNCA